MRVLGVQPRKLRPVHARLQVMHGVVAVVEQQDVEGPGDEVPRVVPLAVRIGLDVLQVIHHLDGEERDLLGMKKNRSAFRQSIRKSAAIDPKKTTYSDAAA